MGSRVGGAACRLRRMCPASSSSTWGSDLATAILHTKARVSNLGSRFTLLPPRLHRNHLGRNARYLPSDPSYAGHWSTVRLEPPDRMSRCNIVYLNCATFASYHKSHAPITHLKALNWRWGNILVYVQQNSDDGTPCKYAAPTHSQHESMFRREGYPCKRHFVRLD